MKYAKLDTYDYDIAEGTDTGDPRYDIVVTVHLTEGGRFDATLFDIASDIAAASNMVYVEGRRFRAVDPTIIYANFSAVEMVVQGTKIEGSK